MSKMFKGSLLATTVIAGMSFTTAAFAQTATTPPTDVTTPAAGVQTTATAGQAEPTSGADIVVTGTLIRNPNLEQSSPVTVIGSDELELQQTNVAEEVLRELPGAVPSVGSQVNNGNGGASFVNLRGLGVNRNLVLLNGTRVVPAGLGGVVDLNNIPLALIERVDILTGGAVTTYGADAISGVVNFITKDDFAGMELSLSEQITERGDGNTFRADLTVGANFDDGRGNAVLSVGYQETDPVTQGDRSFGAFNIDSYTGRPGGSSAAIPATLAGYGGPFRQISPDGQTLVPFYAPFNFNPQNIFQTPFKRYNVFASAQYEVTDGIEAYSQALFSKNSVTTRIASSASFFETYTFPFSNPFIPTAIRSSICTAQGLTPAQCTAAAAATDPNDPNYRTFRSQVRRRFIEAGTRDNEYTTTLFQVKTGIRGDITDTLRFDLFGTYGESENVSRQTGNGLKSRLQQALLATNPNTCLDPTGGCVPFNLFGLPGSITPEQLGFVVSSVTTGGSTETSLATVQGVVSGDFGVGSPWADEPIGIAVGAEYRSYVASSVSDLATQTPGEVLGNGGASPDVTGKYNVSEVFGEIIAPLVTDRPFFHSLTLEAGARYSNYSTSGNSFTWKVGGSWEPVRSLKIRGSYNRATRAPNIGELFSPNVTGLDNLTIDPCSEGKPLANPNLAAVCVAQGAPVGQIGLIADPAAAQVNITSGGNPNLDVEKATTYTIGAVFQPDFVPGLTASVDYYNIKVVDAITTPTVGDALNACFGNITAASANDPACTGIRRNPLTGGLDGSTANTPGLPLGLSNLGRITTDGVDLALNYRRNMGFAKLALGFNGNWTNSAKFQATPTSVNRECVGYYSVNCGSIQPKYSFNQRTTLSFGPMDVSLLWRYIHGVKYEPLALEDDIAAGGGPLEKFRTIPAEHYFDLSTRFGITDHFTLTLTVQNLLDNQPKLVGSSIGSTAFNSGNVYPSTYDPLGRRYAAGVRLRF